MRIDLSVLAFAVLCSGGRLFGQAVDPDSVVLGFELPPQRLTKALLLNPEEWKFGVTEPRKETRVITDPKEVKRFLLPKADDDVKKFRIKSRDNYVFVARQVPPGFENARRLSWKWSVAKHPHGGRIGGSPNDQAIQVYAFYREMKSVDMPEYSGISFVWTENTQDAEETLLARLPWPGSPTAPIRAHAIRNGATPGEFAEEVDLTAYYRKAFRREPPPLWVLVVLADSNEVEPDIGEMTTDATIRDIRLTKQRNGQER